MTAKFHPRYYRAAHSYIATEWRRQPGPDGGANFAGEGAGPPPQWVLDKIAEETITGRFNTKRDNRCPTCFMCRSANGSCNCE
jgi:hypothetical protein